MMGQGRRHPPLHLHHHGRMVALLLLDTLTVASCLGPPALATILKPNLYGTRRKVKVLGKERTHLRRGKVRMTKDLVQRGNLVGRQSLPFGFDKLRNTHANTK